MLAARFNLQRWLCNLRSQLNCKSMRWQLAPSKAKQTDGTCARIIMQIGARIQHVLDIIVCCPHVHTFLESETGSTLVINGHRVAGAPKTDISPRMEVAAVRLEPHHSWGCCSKVMTASSGEIPHEIYRNTRFFEHHRPVTVMT